MRIRRGIGVAAIGAAIITLGAACSLSFVPHQFRGNNLIIVVGFWFTPFLLCSVGVSLPAARWTISVGEGVGIAVVIVLGLVQEVMILSQFLVVLKGEQPSFFILAIIGSFFWFIQMLFGAMCLGFGFFFLLFPSPLHGICRNRRLNNSANLPLDAPRANGDDPNAPWW